MILSFGAKAEFLGGSNAVAGGIQCDGTVLTRGSLGCTSSVKSPK